MAGLADAATWRGRLEAALPVFEEIPLFAASGVTWVHENAMSPDRYLPETMGPGVAFVDYDNDGWMDLFMVNSGPADFFTPKTPLDKVPASNKAYGRAAASPRQAFERRREAAAAPGCRGSRRG